MVRNEFKSTYVDNFVFERLHRPNQSEGGKPEGSFVPFHRPKTPPAAGVQSEPEHSNQTITI